MFGYFGKCVDVSVLVGQTIKAINGLSQYSDEVKIYTEEGNEYSFLHYQDCCEHVRLEDFEGDSEDMAGAMIVSAECVNNADDPKDRGEGYDDSHTWTFYKIETSKGGLWMRWLGESNGYYGEDVDLMWVNKPDDKD